MKRRSFLKQAAVAAAGLGMLSAPAFSPGSGAAEGDAASFPNERRKDWLARWEKHIQNGAAVERYCDREMGEEIGWLISPFLEGFYFGYLATRDASWIRFLIDWAESWVRRGVKEPDGFVGWPKRGTGGLIEEDFLTDSLLGEAMALRPLVLAARMISTSPELNKSFGSKAAGWVKLAEQIFEKWDSRGCWREVKAGGLWVVPGFGLDERTGGWTAGYSRRATDGFSFPDNKQNHIARWLLALHEATGQPVYRTRAEQWFHLMRSRMATREDGRYFVWNYWEPAGPWDYRPNGSPKHWVGVHPNGGYYLIDLQGIVAAFEHNLVFTRDEVLRLVATNRDFMWNQRYQDARFKRIDGGEPDPRWKDSPGVLWTPLVPYDKTLRRIFLENNKPDSWNGLVVTPWFLAREAAPFQ